MKRYLVYHDKSPEGGIDAVDYIDALRKARLRTPKSLRKHIRIRLVRAQSSSAVTLLSALAAQKEYGH